MAAMVNMNSLLSGKDSRWLQLEVCREFQRNKCSRQDTECKFAHPPANVEVQNGKVTACYDSIKGRCNRDKPPCKYFHPPQHLKDQLLINGRNHLALKNALIQQMGTMTPGQPVMPGQVPTVAANPYLTGIPTNTFSPFYAPGHLVPALLGPDPTAVASQLGPVVPQAVQVAQQKIPRSDRLEMDVKTVGSFYYENFAFSGVVPYKRPAAEKSGIPVYQPGATTYQQLMQLQQPFVPVSYDKVEVCDHRVAVCRDHANGQCRRKQCKYYHIPIVLPPANVMAALINNNSNNNNFNMNMNMNMSMNMNSNNSTIIANNNMNINNNNNNTNMQNMNTPQILTNIGYDGGDQQHQQQQQQQQQQLQLTAALNKGILHAATTTATPTSNYNNNLIIIEPALQPQQHSQQLHYATSYYTSSNSIPSLPRNTITTTAAPINLYHHHQQHQQPQHTFQPNAGIAYHCHSPYSPSSTSSSSSCSIATSPTTLASTLSTTSTVTIPTAISSNYAAIPPTPTTSYIRTGSTTSTTHALLPQYYDMTTGVAPTFVLSNDYNSNCVPILATSPAQPTPATSFIYPATTPQTPATYVSNQQHLMKYSQQHYHHYAQHQPQAMLQVTKTIQPQQRSQQQQPQYQQQHRHQQQQPLLSTIAATVATATTTTEATAAASSPSASTTSSTAPSTACSN